jgi:hypothetical protein
MWILRMLVFYLFQVGTSDYDKALQVMLKEDGRVALFRYDTELDPESDLCIHLRRYRNKVSIALFGKFCSNNPKRSI